MQIPDKLSKYNLAGKVFGRLFVATFSHYEPKNRSYYWICVCECGAEKKIKGAALRSGVTKSCGCIQKEKAKSAGDRTKTHGMSKTKVYAIWDSMRQRCTNKKRKDYKAYGGRGIAVCGRWASFEFFLEDMGLPPDGMSIDRKDTNGDYEPLNCRWATTKEQAKNTTKTIFLTANGETKCLSDWVEELGISYETLSARLRRGWDEHKAINTPVDKRFSRTNLLRGERGDM